MFRLGFRKIRRRTLLWMNRARFDVRVERKGSWARLVLHERFRSAVRWLKWLLTAVGLLLAFVAFSSEWVSFLVGVAVWLVTTLAEKVVFSYNSMFVHSLPDFEIQPASWLGAFFGYGAQLGNPLQIPLVGWIMRDADYARKVHALLLRWSYGELNDEESNICASVVVLSDTEYIFYCYPRLDRHSATHFFEEVEQRRRQESREDVHDRQMALLIFGKRCLINPGSYFPTFRQRYTPGVPYLFRLVVAGPRNEVREIAGLPDFVLHNLKIREREQLDRQDIEFDLLRISGT